MVQLTHSNTPATKFSMVTNNRQDPNDERLKNYLADNYDLGKGVYMPDGYSSAFVGLSVNDGNNPVLVYDVTKIINILVERHGMDEEQAMEYFETEIAGFKAEDNNQPIFILNLEEDFASDE
jgi:hypothetical protein